MIITTKKELLQIIRMKCLECCSGDIEEVMNCTAGPNSSEFSQCVLWAFRFGKDIKTDEQN